MLKRKFYDSLLEWKSNHGQECLLVKGARQVGKTFIIDYFGNANYSSYLYLNFVLNKEAAECFGDNLDADVIFKRFTARYPRFKLIPGDTLVFLDEIQACPRARTALKSLAIDGRADVVASGSLLGINFLDDGLEKERAKESCSRLSPSRTPARRCFPSPSLKPPINARLHQSRGRKYRGRRGRCNDS